MPVNNYYILQKYRLFAVLLNFWSRWKLKLYLQFIPATWTQTTKQLLLILTSSGILFANIANTFKLALMLLPIHLHFAM